MPNSNFHKFKYCDILQEKEKPAFLHLQSNLEFMTYYSNRAYVTAWYKISYPIFKITKTDLIWNFTLMI